MHLEILGTRGEIEESAPWHYRHSGVLVDGRLLLDLGEREYLDLHPKLVAITHLHPDHAFFVTQEGSTDIPLYAPEEYHNQVQVQALPEQLTRDGYVIRPLPTHHSKLVRSAALVVHDDSRTICYTGDIIWLNKEYHGFLKGLDLVITDGSYIRKGGMVRKDPGTGQLYGHTGIPDLIRLFSEFTNRILFVHFGSWFFKDIADAREKIRALGEENGVDAQATRDGEEVVV
ncbi:MAG: MBL fold metallo-hydrolase [Methanomicrobiales archaeon]|nr:MBL fold metallo-hydrolase [Methanomicrobiales archaeon]